MAWRSALRRLYTGSRFAFPEAKALEAGVHRAHKERVCGGGRGGGGGGGGGRGGGRSGTKDVEKENKSREHLCFLAEKSTPVRK